MPIAPVITAQPWLPQRNLTPSQVLHEGRANWFDSACCPLASTLTTKWLACSNAARRLERVDRQNRTRGGSSDTEVNEFTVTPVCSPSGVSVVTMVTPVV